MNRALAFLCILLVAAVLGGCPPPGDPVDAYDGVARPTVVDGERPAAAPDGAAPSTDAGGVAVQDGPQDVVLSALDTGTVVARCPACGQIQAAGAGACGDCGQVLAPWRAESVCPTCAGEGRCHRCGDDRRCLSCTGDGRCDTCGGGGELPDGGCVECDGDGVCAVCRGDGFRESTAGDFLPRETHLPGLCSTCADGSGRCPDCGGDGAGAAGSPCSTCNGDGICPDCDRRGACPFDRGDGLCATCGGGGRIVLNGAAPPPSTRTWNVRKADGSVIVATVPRRPSPNVTVQTVVDGELKEMAFRPTDVSPLSYYNAVRDHTSAADYAGLLALADAALGRELPALAVRDIGRARLAATADDDEVTTRIAEAKMRRVQQWLDLAEELHASGVSAEAVPLLRLVVVEQATAASASRAADLLANIRESATKTITPDRGARVLRRANHRLRRGHRLLRMASDARAETGRERTFDRADEAARTAERLIFEEVALMAAGDSSWPADPLATAREARALRAEIALARAAAHIAAGRFASGARFARRAIDLDQTETRGRKLLDTAELGMARAGVHAGSPPPEEQE